MDQTPDLDALRVRVHGVQAAVAIWNPDLHPRGRDGKWIEKLGLVRLFGFQHPRSNERVSESTGVVRNILGEDRVIVELPDSTKVAVKSSQIESLGEKARLTFHYNNENFLDTVKQTDAAEFFKGFDTARQGKYGAFLSDFDESHFAQENVDVYSAFDGKVGAALTRHDDGRVEVGSLYALDGAPPKAGIDLLRYLLDEKGVNWLNNFDGPLTDMYEANGFGIDTSDPWNEEYAPEGWDYERFDHPAYITMSRKMGRPLLGVENGRSTDTGTTGTNQDGTLRQDGIPVGPGVGVVTSGVDGRAIPNDAGLRATGRTALGTDDLTTLRSRVHGITAAFDPGLHPRGRDGRFIEVGWLINLIDMAGFRHNQRGSEEVQGEVVEIIPDPDNPDDPIIRVKMTDPRWDTDAFGPTFDARSYQVSKRDAPKAKVPSKPSTPKPSTVSKPTPYVSNANAGEPLDPLVPPSGWDTMSVDEASAWVNEAMSADLTKFRNKETVWNLTGSAPEISLRLGNSYRALTHEDTETALRIDFVLTDSQVGIAGDPKIKSTGSGAIAVAHPGTEHPGGIGPVIGKTAIVLGDTYFKSMHYWDNDKKNIKGGVPWSMSSVSGDPSQTLTHEFGHHRQFRFLESTMSEVGLAWSDVVQEDGFGTLPDSSNWPEIQQARYDIQKAAPSKYGQSKSSEAYAEMWAARLIGYELSDEANAAWDAWHNGMEIPDRLPKTRFAFDDRKRFEDLTPEEVNAYWALVGSVFEIPGMREHYPDTAAKFDAWDGPTKSGGAIRSTEGAEHEAFADSFNLLLDDLESKYSDITGTELAYVGTGTDELGRKFFTEAVAYQLENPVGPLSKLASQIELEQLKNGVSIWDLGSMKGVIGQTITTPERIIMLVNPDTDPAADNQAHVGLSNMEVVMSHEYGHVITRSVARKAGWMSPVTEIKNVDTPQYFHHYLRSWGNLMGQNSPTEYGSRNEQEAIAEAFVRYHHGMEGDVGWEQFLKNIRVVMDGWYDNEDTIATSGEPDQKWLEDVKALIDMLSEVGTLGAVI